MAQKNVSGVLTPLCEGLICISLNGMELEYFPNNASAAKKAIAREKNKELDDSINQDERAIQGYIEFVQDSEGLLIFTKDGEIIAVIIVGREYVADDKEGFEHKDPCQDGYLFEMNELGNMDISSINVHDSHCDSETMDAIFLLLKEYIAIRKYPGITLPRILPVHIFGRTEDEEYFTTKWGCVPEETDYLIRTFPV